MIRYFSFPKGLWILQGLYLLGQRLDRFFRSRHAQYAPFPTICVGNFQAGGTGKTPVTQWIATELKALGYEPIVLLRGYKGKLVESALVTSMDAEIYGDEALLHASHFPTIVGKNRQASCAIAKSISTGNKTVLILDDGLQHYPLKTDFSVVCQKSKKFEYDTLLPQGRLREIPHNRMDAIISSVTTDKPMEPQFWRGVPEFFLQRKMKLCSGPSLPGLLVCGIARPNDFFYQVQQQIGLCPGELAFSDHHRYTTREVKKIESMSASSDYRVHCSAKDAVKLAPLIASLKSPLQLSVWDIELEPISDVRPLFEKMVAKIEEVYKNRPLKGEQKA